MCVLARPKARNGKLGQCSNNTLSILFFYCKQTISHSPCSAYNLNYSVALFFPETCDDICATPARSIVCRCYLFHRTYSEDGVQSKLIRGSQL